MTADGGRGDQVPRRLSIVRFRNQNGTIFVYRDEEGWELSEVAGRIWRLCDGRRSVREIADSVAEQFEVEAEVALADTIEFLDDLHHDRLIEWAPAAQT
jgi:hypothetical protein